jgi:hypothetical protein
MARRGVDDRAGETIRLEPAGDANLEVDGPRLLTMVQVEIELVERIELNRLHPDHDPLSAAAL